ncbi:hypothetical protein [Actinorhabdospora filicis]|uniref:hypothetical protein n=1 Tax=Actinorhabdospora filicis TaxID=1785913 RepID=UPI002553320A|nr:hypothetical protein [Actinorhabdospora filicis]
MSGGARGTGLLVARDLVLTASHCVPSKEVRTSFGAGRVVWRARKPDAALIRLDAPVDVPGPLRWGRVVGGAPLVAHAIGFPRVSHPRAHHLEARLRPDFSLAPLTAPPQEDSWRGFSGAALFAEGLLVGVVTHTPEDWENRELLALPVATLMRDPSFARYVGAPRLREVELERLQVPDVIARSPAMLLRADVEATTFQPGRERVLAELDAWSGGPKRQDALLVTGPGGQGKSRLGLEFGHRMRAKGWAVLHLRDDTPDLVALTSVTTPLLVVVDYAERRDLARLAEALPEQEPVRVLMLARHDDGWREHLGPHASLLSAAGQIALPELFTEPPDVRGLTGEYTRGLRSLGLDPRGEVTPPREARTALGVHMHVLAGLLDDGDEPAQGRILDHEARYWAATAVRHGLDLSPGTMRTAVAVASSIPADTREDALSALALVPGVRDLPEDARLRAAGWLRGLYPGGERWWGALQPDRLAEWLYAERRRAEPEVMREAFRLAVRLGGVLDRLGLTLDLAEAEAIGAGDAIAALRDLAAEADLENSGGVLTYLDSLLMGAGHYADAVRVRQQLTEIGRATADNDTNRWRLIRDLVALAALADPDAAERAAFQTGGRSPYLRATIFRRYLPYDYRKHTEGVTDPVTPERRALAAPALVEALTLAAAMYDGEPTHHGWLGALHFWIMDAGETADVIAAHRVLAEAHRRLEDDPEQARYLTNILAGLGASLANAGRFEESLAAFTEAVERYRRPGAPDQELRRRAEKDLGRVQQILKHDTR